MKRILGIVLALCLVLTLCTDAFAASKPKFTKQPKTATTNKKGTSVSRWAPAERAT